MRLLLKWKPPNGAEKGDFNTFLLIPAINPILYFLSEGTKQIKESVLWELIFKYFIAMKGCGSQVKVFSYSSNEILINFMMGGHFYKF